jgi:hypothetical protein
LTGLNGEPSNQDKQGGILSPGPMKFQEIQKMWGERTDAAKKEDIMSMSVDALPKDTFASDKPKVNKILFNKINKVNKILSFGLFRWNHII